MTDRQPRFVVSKHNGFFRFEFLDADDKRLLGSEVYHSKRACLEGVEAVKRLAPVATIVLHTP